MPTQIPYLRIAAAADDFSKDRLNDAMHRALVMSETRPCCVELSDSVCQRVLFFRERQIYAAGKVESGQFLESSIRDFLVNSAGMNFPRLVCYELDNKILHSLLVMCQKKPTLRVLTSLVDLDELLDRIEREGKSCVVTACRENFMAVLRYEKGRATAMCFDECRTTPVESTFREDFLVKIYTESAQDPLTISLYEDLLVSYADDAKNIPADFTGRFEDFFLSKPPMIILKFRDREIDHWEFDRPSFRIGRTPDNDIVIDNLAVSRLHAVLEEEKGIYYVRDCDSLNGTVVNGKKVGRARLGNGDQISIGKHTICFRAQGGQAVPSGESVQGFDQTMIFEAHSKKPLNAPAIAPQADAKRNPRLIVKTSYGDRVVELTNEPLTIGKDVDADVAIDGWFVAKHHVEIIRKHGRVVLRHLSGLRRVTVDGRPVREIELKDNDEIKIANEAFVFQE